MGLKVTYNNENFPEGQEFDIGGVLVENGGSVELTEEQELALVSRTGMAVRDYFADTEDVKVEGTAAFTPAKVEDLVEPSVLPPPPNDKEGGEED